MKDYLVIYEPTPTGWSAYSPDVPGCVTAGDTREETERLMGEALRFHFEGLRSAGLPIPEPSNDAGHVAA